MSDTYYQPKAHADAAKQVQKRMPGDKKQVVTTWKDVLGIGKKKTLRKVDKDVEDNS